MKWIRTALIMGLLISNNSLLIADVAPAANTSEKKSTDHTSISSPASHTDMSATSSHESEEPVFPLEDLIEQPNKGNDKFFSEFLNMLATLGLVIALILIAAWFIKRLLNTRMEQINTSSLIKIIDKRSISPKTGLYLLEIYDKKVLIAETQAGVAKLAEFGTESSDSESPPQDIPPSFSEILERNKNK